MDLALIAFDGLDPRIVYENRDELPTFDRVMEDSMHGKWDTPGHTIPSFTATLTGQFYDEYNFHWDEGKGNFQRHRQTEFEYLWETLNGSVTLVNMPVLYPPEDIEDAMVCGFLTPDSMADRNMARPTEVQEIINDMEYIHDIPANETYEEAGGDGMFNILTDMMDKRIQLSEILIDKYDSDLFYGAWTATDRWFHQCFMHGEEKIRMYKKADEVLDEMLDNIPDDIPTIIFSDHGFAHFPEDEDVHKGHMHEGWYSIMSDKVPHYRDDSLSIFDLYPTVVNYFNDEVPEWSEGRVLFNNDEQDEQVKDRLSSLGYLDEE